MSDTAGSIDTVRERLLAAIKLKEVARAGWRRVGLTECESVAAHSWGVAWLVMVLCPRELQRERALQMALVHDMAEVSVGDLTPYDGVEHAEKVTREAEAFSRLVADLPIQGLATELFSEYVECATPESKFVHAMDKLDMALQAQQYGSSLSPVAQREFLNSALKQLDTGLYRDLASPAAGAGESGL